MEPYTVAGLARRENEAVDCGPEDLDPGQGLACPVKGFPLT